MNCISLREVCPEILDELPPDDPAAQRARDDLVRINLVMRNAAIFYRYLLPVWKLEPPSHIVDLGGGDGRFLHALLKKIGRLMEPVSVTIVDRNTNLSEKTKLAFHETGWRLNLVQADVYEWLNEQKPGHERVWMLANLFLHHFQPVDLEKLLGLVSQTAAGFSCCEPRRSGGAMLGTTLLPLLGVNKVTRHDARISVRAGFRDCELTALWKDRDSWKLTEYEEGPFTHFFSAVRREA